MLKQTTSASQFTSVRNDHPYSSTPLTTSGVGTSATTDAYSCLLGSFPSSMHGDILQILPDLGQLQVFHQGFIDRQCPLTEKSVAHELCAVRDHRIALQELQRRRHITHVQGDPHTNLHDPYGTSPLLQAILDNDVGQARIILSTASAAAVKPPRIHTKGSTPIADTSNFLRQSAGNDMRQQAIPAVLKNRDTSSRPNAQILTKQSGDNPLSFALANGASEGMVKLLVEYYAAHASFMLSMPDATGVPPLIAAVFSRRQDLVQLLLKQQAVDINGRSAESKTALMYCVISNDASMLALLLARDTDLDSRDDIGRTAQDLALLANLPDTYLLLAKERMRRYSASTAKFELAETSAPGDQIIRDFHSAAVMGYPTMLKSMLKNFGHWLNPDVIASALSEAIQMPGKSAIAAVLLDPEQTGIEVKQIASPGLELFAADAPTFDIIARAIYPADPNDADTEDLRQLMQSAASFGLITWVNYALQAGIDLDWIDADHDSTHGIRLLVTALQQKNMQMLKALLQTGTPFQIWLADDKKTLNTVLELTAKYGTAETFNLVLQACPLKPDNDKRQMQYWLALAARAGSLSSCQLIMDKTGIVLPATATRRLNPLLQAVIYRQNDVQAFLLSRGAHGCLKHKGKFKSAIEKAVTMQDAKAVANIVKCDQYLLAELPPLMDQLMSNAIANTDTVSFELLVHAMIKFDPLPERLVRAAEQAISIGCSPALKIVLEKMALKGWGFMRTYSLLEKAIRMRSPSIDIVKQLLLAEGHPTSCFGSIYAPIHVLQVESSGAKRLVDALIAADPADEVKTFWLSTILCQSYPDTDSESIYDMTIHEWRQLVAPLVRSMENDGGYTAALSLAATMAVTAPKPIRVCEVIFNATAPALKVDIDLMPAARAILTHQRLDLLPLLPEDVRTNLKAESITQFAMASNH